MLRCLLLGQYRICGIIYCQLHGAMPVLGALLAAWYNASCMDGLQIARSSCQMPVLLARRPQLHCGDWPGALHRWRTMAVRWLLHFALLLGNHLCLCSTRIPLQYSTGMWYNVYIYEERQ